MFKNGYISLNNNRFGIDNTFEFFINFYMIATIYILPLFIMGAFNINIPKFFIIIGFLFLAAGIVITIIVRKINYRYCTKNKELLEKYIERLTKRKGIEKLEKLNDNIYLLYLKNCEIPLKMTVNKDLEWYMISIEYKNKKNSIKYI